MKSKKPVGRKKPTIRKKVKKYANGGGGRPLTPAEKARKKRMADAARKKAKRRTPAQKAALNKKVDNLLSSVKFGKGGKKKMSYKYKKKK